MGMTSTTADTGQMKCIVSCSHVQPRDQRRACSQGPKLLWEHSESAVLGEAGCVISRRGDPGIHQRMLA